MNPYQPPKLTDASYSPLGPRRDRGVVFIAIMMTCGVLVHFASGFNPELRLFLKARFGSIGLILGSNLLVFVGFYLFKPLRQYLLAATLMSLFLAIVSAFGLIRSGTVARVVDAQRERLHESWLWAVVPYVLMTLYLFFATRRERSKSSVKPQPNSNRQHAPVEAFGDTSVARIDGASTEVTTESTPR